MNNVSKKLMLETAQQAYDSLKKRYWLSRFWFIVLNFASISLTTILIILNLYVIQNGQNPELTKSLYYFTKKWFVVISCISAFSGTVSSTIAFIKIKPKMRIIKAAIEKINETLEDYRLRKPPFRLKAKRDEYFLKTILEIVASTVII